MNPIKPGLNRTLIGLAPALVAGMLAFAAPARGAEGEEHAVWKAQELSFDYMGFTSQYSCEGLRDKVEQALRALGARDDLSIQAYPCARMGRPERFPSLEIKLSTLQPALSAVAEGGVGAHWKTVNLAGYTKLDAGDCELADQIREKILPLFTTRNVSTYTNCFPHQERAGGLQFTLEVLVPAKG